MNIKNLKLDFDIKKMLKSKDLAMSLMVLVILFFLFKNINNGLIEGMDNNNQGTKNGPETIGTKLTDYNSNIKKSNVLSTDSFLIDKYREDFENLVLGLEQYGNNLMLHKILSVSDLISKNKIDDPNSSRKIINEMDQTNKIKQFLESLNSVIKYIDRSK
jgi:hypothetical protein